VNFNDQCSYQQKDVV